MPAISAHESGHRGQQAVGAEAVHQREVGVGHLGRVAVDDVGDVDHVEQAVLVQPGRDHVGQILRDALRTEFMGFLFDDGFIVAAQPLRHPRCQHADLLGEAVDLGAHRQRLRTVIEQPTSGTVDKPA